MSAGRCSDRVQSRRLRGVRGHERRRADRGGGGTAMFRSREEAAERLAPWGKERRGVFVPV